MLNALLRRTNKQTSAQDPALIHEECIKMFRVEFGNTMEQWDSLILTPIRNLFRYVADLPASETGHHNDQHGLLTHLIDTAFYSFRLANDKEFGVRDYSEVRYQLKNRYIYCATLAGLFRDAGKIAANFNLRLEDRLWDPFICDYLTFNPSLARPDIEWLSEKTERTAHCFSLSLLHLCLPKASWEYLSWRKGRLAHELVMQVAGSPQSNPKIADIVADASETSIKKYLTKKLADKTLSMTDTQMFSYAFSSLMRRDWKNRGGSGKYFNVGEDLYLQYPNGVLDWMETLRSWGNGWLVEDINVFLDMLSERGFIAKSSNLQHDEYCFILKNEESPIESIRSGQMAVKISKSELLSSRWENPLDCNVSPAPSSYLETEDDSEIIQAPKVPSHETPSNERAPMHWEELQERSDSEREEAVEPPKKASTSKTDGSEDRSGIIEQSPLMHSNENSGIDHPESDKHNEQSDESAERNQSDNIHALEPSVKKQHLSQLSENESGALVLAALIRALKIKSIEEKLRIYCRDGEIWAPYPDVFEIFGFTARTALQELVENNWVLKPKDRVWVKKKIGNHDKFIIFSKETTRHILSESGRSADEFSPNAAKKDDGGLDGAKKEERKSSEEGKAEVFSAIDNWIKTSRTQIAQNGNRVGDNIHYPSFELMMALRAKFPNFKEGEIADLLTQKGLGDVHEVKSKKCILIPVKDVDL